MANISLEDRTRTAIRLLLIAAAGVAAVAPVYIVLGNRTARPLFIPAAGVMFILALALLSASLLARQKRVDRAMWIYALALFGAVLVANVLFSGAGLGLGLAFGFSTWQVAAATVTSTHHPRFYVVALGGAIAVILLDIFGSSGRLFVPTLQLATLFVGVAALLIASVSTFRGYQRYSLTGKLVSAALLFIVLAVGATALVGSQFVRVQLIANLNDEFRTLARAQASTIADRLTAEVNLLNVLAFDEAVREQLASANGAYAGDESANLAALSQEWTGASDVSNLVLSRTTNGAALVLRDFQQRFPEHADILVTDQFGGIAAAPARTSRYSFASTEWWRATSTNRGNPYIGAPRLDPDTGSLSIVFAIGLYDNDASSTAPQLLGVLKTTVVIDGTNTFFAGSNTLPSQIGVDLLTDDGIVSFEQGARRYKTYGQNDAATVSGLRSNPETGVFAPFGGERSYLFWYPVSSDGLLSAVDNLNWSLIVYQPEAAALTAVSALQNTTILIGLLTSVVGVIAATVVANVVSRPITELTDVARTVAAGDFSRRAAAESSDEVGQLASTFNAMTEQIAQTVTGLEAEVARRTRALEISTTISRRLLTIFDPDELVAELVTQLQRAFGYYHVHVYLLDSDTGTLRLVHGAGEVGAQLVAQKHTLSLGKGIVGRAAARNKSLLVADVHADRHWLPNPLLPDTRAELAVPFSRDRRVIGVIDVQQDESGSLTSQDATLLEVVAGQFAIAWQNAALYTDARRQAEQQARINAATARIIALPSEEATLKIAVRELGKQTGAAHTYVTVQDRSGTGRPRGVSK